MQANRQLATPESVLFRSRQPQEPLKAEHCSVWAVSIRNSTTGRRCCLCFSTGPEHSQAMLSPCRSVGFPAKRDPNRASSEVPLCCRHISKHGGKHLVNKVRIPGAVANSVRREIARTGAPIVVWFEAAGMGRPGFGFSPRVDCLARVRERSRDPSIERGSLRS